jgi:hypothetical protein
MRKVIAVLLVIALIPALVSFAQDYTINTILEHSLAVTGDYPNGVFPIFNSMLVLVRSGDGNDNVSGIYDGRTGKLITPGHFNFRIGHHEETWFRQGADLAVIWSRDDEGLKFGFLDKSGRIAVPLIYDEVMDFKEGLALVRLGENEGFVNGKGETVVPLIYDSFDYYLMQANEFHEGLARVRLDGKWGYVNTSGEVVIPFEFDTASYFSEGLASVGRDGRDGVINTAGELVIDFKDFRISEFKDGIAIISIRPDGDTGFEWMYTKSGLMNNKGEIILPIEYDSIGHFSEGLAEVFIGDRGSRIGKWGFVNTSGELIVPIIYDGSRSFENGLAKVSVGSWGRINTSGEVIIPLEYGWTWSLGEDLIAVSVRGTDEVKVYNTNGEVVFPAGMFDHYGYFLMDDVLPAAVDDKWGLINLDGEIILPLEYEHGSFFSTRRATFFDGMTFIQQGRKWGFATIKGEVIAPPQYDFVEIHLNGFAWVAIGEDWHDVKCGYINRAGEFVIPLEYSRAIYAGGENNVHYFWLEKDGLWGVVSVSGDYADGNPRTGTVNSLVYIFSAALIGITVLKKKGTKA